MGSKARQVGSGAAVHKRVLLEPKRVPRAQRAAAGRAPRTGGQPAARGLCRLGAWADPARRHGRLPRVHLQARSSALHAQTKGPCGLRRMAARSRCRAALCSAVLLLMARGCRD